MEEKRKGNSIFGIVFLGLIVLAVVTVFAVFFKTPKPEPTTLTASATVASSAATTRKATTTKVTTTKKTGSAAATRKPEKTTAKKETKTTKAPSTTKRKGGFSLGKDKYNYTTTKRHGRIGGRDDGATIGRDPTTTKAYTTTKRYTTTTKKKRYDPYNAADYVDPEDFYDDNYDNFFDYYDAENYYYDHCDD